MIVLGFFTWKMLFEYPKTLEHNYKGQQMNIFFTHTHTQLGLGIGWKLQGTDISFIRAILHV